MAKARKRPGRPRPWDVKRVRPISRLGGHLPPSPQGWRLEGWRAGSSDGIREGAEGVSDRCCDQQVMGKRERVPRENDRLQGGVWDEVMSLFG